MESHRRPRNGLRVLSRHLSAAREVHAAGYDDPQLYPKERPLSKLDFSWPANGTKGQPQPFAANGGRKWSDFQDRPDGGSAVAGQAALKWMESRPPPKFTRAASGPLETEYGVGFSSFAECQQFIEAQGLQSDVPGEVCIPINYSINDAPSFTLVPSHTIHELQPERIREASQRAFGGDRVDNLYFPQVMRDGRRVSSYRPHLPAIDQLQTFDELGICCLSRPSNIGDYCWDDHKRVRDEYYLECEQMCLDFFPGATRAYVFDHELRDKDRLRAPNQNVPVDHPDFDPGILGYANSVHNDYTDNSGPNRAFELLTANVRSWNPKPVMTGEEADALLSRRFIQLNMWRPLETIEQNPLCLCAWPSFADQPYSTTYRVYDDRVGEIQSFTRREDHEWYFLRTLRPQDSCPHSHSARAIHTVVAGNCDESIRSAHAEPVRCRHRYWFPRQRPEEIAFLKCYDSINDGVMSRWSFHTSGILPGVPRDAPSRKNIVVRCFVFF